MLCLAGTAVQINATAGLSKAHAVEVLSRLINSTAVLRDLTHVVGCCCCDFGV
jgi:hypothetical protein